MAILMLILIVICYWNPAPIFGPYIRSRCFLQLFEMKDKKKKMLLVYNFYNKSPANLDKLDIC